MSNSKHYKNQLFIAVPFIPIELPPKDFVSNKSMALQYCLIPPLGLPVCILYYTWIDYLLLQKKSWDQTEMKVVN